MNNPVVYTPRIQRLAQPLHIGLDVLLYDKNVYLHYWVNGKKTRLNITELCEKKNLPDPLAVAMEQIRKATEQDQGAFISAPIPCNCNQQGVIAFSNGGITKECSLRKNECAMISKAYDSYVTSHTTMSNKPIDVQTISNATPIKEEEIEYKENIDELKAMRECFEPECDYVVKEPEGYIVAGPGEFDDIPEFDDLPD